MAETTPRRPRTRRTSAAKAAPKAETDASATAEPDLGAAAEAAAARTAEMLEASLGAAEAMAARLAAQIEAAEDARKTFEARLAQAISAAESNVGNLGERLEARMKEAIAAGEAHFARLTEQLDTQRTAAEQAGQRALTLQQDALAGAGVAGAALDEGFAEARKRIADFVAERLRQDIEIQGQLLSCRTLDDVRDVQSRFFRSAVDHYAAEASRMMQLGTDVVARTLPKGGGRT